MKIDDKTTGEPLARFYEAGVLFLAAVFGIWIYAIIGGVIGTVEAFWWGGKGWFIPIMGMMALAIGAIPSNWIAQRISLRISDVRFSLLTLAAIGLVQGLILVLVLEIVSSFSNILISLTGIKPMGWSDLIVASIKIAASILISSVLPSLVFGLYFYHYGGKAKGNQ